MKERIQRDKLLGQQNSQIVNSFFWASGSTNWNRSVLTDALENVAR
jgi:hypothetical protein